MRKSYCLHFKQQKGRCFLVNSKVSERKSLRYLTVLEKQHEETKYLPYKRTGHESNESNSSTHNSCFPTTKHVCEDADYRAAKENHPHGERTYPCCKERKKQRDIMTW